MMLLMLMFHIQAFCHKKILVMTLLCVTNWFDFCDVLCK